MANGRRSPQTHHQVDILNRLIRQTDCSRVVGLCRLIATSPSHTIYTNHSAEGIRQELDF